MQLFSEACERNKEPILSILQVAFKEQTTVLEVGSGSGQHALFFSEKLPHLQWQTSEMPENLTSLKANLQADSSGSLADPLSLNVCQHPWPTSPVSAIFTANTLHIMSWQSVEELFVGIGQNLQPEGILCIYGPFCYNGNYTSESNEKFDQWLKNRDSQSGIRDFEKVNGLATKINLELIADHSMPANNQCIVWKRSK